MFQPPRVDAAARASRRAGAVRHLAGGRGPVYLTPTGLPDCPPQPDNAPCPPLPGTWSGEITLVTSDFADGIYTGDTLQSITVDATFFNVTSPGLNVDHGVPVPGSFASVTIWNGWVTSFDFTWANQDNFEYADFSGLFAHYARYGAPYGPSIDAVSAVTDIPEPEVLVLMTAGLLLTGMAVRARRSATLHSSQRT